MNSFLVTLGLLAISVMNGSEVLIYLLYYLFTANGGTDNVARETDWLILSSKTDFPNFSNTIDLFFVLSCYVVDNTEWLSYTLEFLIGFI